MTDGNEPNAPNTVDNCPDGNSGTYYSDESLEKIVVRLGYADGQGSGELMLQGGRATIIATVYAFSTGLSDFADFYYATDDDTEWKFIKTEKPSGGGVQEILVDYELPQAGTHRVRVNYRYKGTARCVFVL